MGCNICKRPAALHGSEFSGARAGSYLAESGCHNGVWMDDDEYAEGWDPNVVTRPCPNNPLACAGCGGSGDLSRNPEYLIECDACEGTGWRGGDWQQPDDRYAEQTADHAGDGLATATAYGSEPAQPNGLSQTPDQGVPPPNPVSHEGEA